MKKKVLASLLCVAMAATMVVGCGSKTDAPADAPAADDAAADDAATDDAAADDAATDDAATTDDAAAGGDYHFEIIVKSYQSSCRQLLRVLSRKQLSLV